MRVSARLTKFICAICCTPLTYYGLRQGCGADGGRCGCDRAGVCAGGEAADERVGEDRSCEEREAEAGGDVLHGWSSWARGPW